MDNAIKFFKMLAKRLDYIAAIVLFLNCALVVLNVITRSALFEMPIFGVYEIVCYLSLISISFALANCAVEGGHTNLTFILEKLSEKKAKIITIIVNIVILINFILIAWNLILYAISRVQVGDVSPVMRLPIVYLMALICIGFILLTITPLINIIEDLRFIKNQPEKLLSSKEGGQ